MTDILEQILARKREEAARLPGSIAPNTGNPARTRRRDFAAALMQPGISVIAEIKRRSPSKGPIAPALHSAETAYRYESGGAAAISCLTDATFFGAKPDDLPTARRATAIPILRKDFIIDARQIHETAAMGADAILFIARALPAATLGDFIASATSLRLASLVEVHDESDIDAALRAGATIIGVNNRDLKTFNVSLDHAIRLRRRIPDNCITVSESGIHTRDDVQRMEQAGYDAVLVGESLASSPDPSLDLRWLLAPESCRNTSEAQT